MNFKIFKKFQETRSLMFSREYKTRYTIEIMKGKNNTRNIYECSTYAPNKSYKQVNNVHIFFSLTFYHAEYIIVLAQWGD